MSNATAISVMRYALQQYHYTESPAGSNKTKFGRDYGADGQPWCSYFVWDSGAHGDGDNPIAKANNAGDIQDWTVSKKGGSWVMPKTKSNKTKAEGMKRAKFGDIASFDFGENDMWRDHTALYIGDGYLIEGNTSFDDKGSQDNGGAVALKLRPSNYICSYARPKYKQKDFYKPTTPYTGPALKLPEDGSFKWGDKGAKALQEALKWSNGYKLDPDGDFGSKTFAEVVIFQVANGLTPDGVFGKKSLDKMNALIEKNAKKDDTDAETKPAETTPAEPKYPALFIPTQGGQCYDLSNHQGVLSVDYFKSLKKKGVACVILRSSYTRLAKFEMHEDAAFKQNIKNAHAAGLHVGIYHYSSAVNVTEAKKEAKFCLKIIKPFVEYIDLPVAFDCEFGTRFTRATAKTLGRSGMGKIADGFLGEIKAAGYEPMLYANLDMLNNYMPTDIYKKYKIWIAQYNSKCQYKYPYYMWQYTSTNGKLDKNKFGTQDTKKKETSTTTETKVAYPGELPSLKLVKTTEEVIKDDIKWLRWIVKDNDFHYGYTNKHGSSDSKKWSPNAHHNGCYFCRTNGKNKAGIVDKEHSYCCNPLIHAGWAHGGCIPKALEICQDGSSWDFNKGHGYDKSSLFDNLGHPDKKKLKPGDVLCNDNHVAEYIGNGVIAEASGGDDNKKGSKKWNNSIRIVELTDKRYASFKRVHRFNGKVNTTCNILHGEVGKRVEKLQNFLKWYGYKVEDDGLFGDATLKYVKAFQKTAGLTVDGVVGQKTIDAMKAARRAA